MKDTISLILVFATALFADSEPWVLLPFVVAIAILQAEKIEKLLKR